MARDGLSVVEKTAILLRRFIDERSPSLGFNAILADSQLSKATAHRLLSDLTKNGFLTQEASGDEYRLGPLLISTGILAQKGAGVREVALPLMEDLRDRFLETIVLAELHGDSVVPIVRLDGLHEMRMNQEVGRHYEAHAGATGQVLLANLPEPEFQEYPGARDLTALTGATYTKKKQLRNILDLTRKAGVGVSRGQRVPGAVAISAPVFTASGQTVAALTISGVAVRWDRARLIEAAVAVRDAAETASARLGGPAAIAGRGSLVDLRNEESEAFQSLLRLIDDSWPREG